MLFVKADDLKKGMRLARPIYNKNGVLLYERNSKLTEQGIISIRNFSLIGIFILEPAEPVPPMTKDDIAFERFQTMGVFAIQEELNQIIKKQQVNKLQSIATDVIRNYGRMDRKINFIQNLRSPEDYYYKHSLNVAILAALMAHALGMKMPEQTDMVMAALVHDIGVMRRDEVGSVSVLLDNALAQLPRVKQIRMQLQAALDAYEKRKKVSDSLDMPARVLMVAEIYDSMTAMKLDGEPASEIKAVRTLLNNPLIFDPQAVGALIRSIAILSPGTCIEFVNGEKGLVLESSDSEVLRPRVLGFRDNRIIDLADDLMFKKNKIKDIMKTLDNRYIIDEDTLKEYGYYRANNDYVAAQEE